MIPNTTDSMKTLDAILDGLMSRYCERVPDVGAIMQCLIRDGLIQSSNDIQNDHIAFRSMGSPQLGIKSLERIFLHCGYERRDRYTFETKKLNAFWYSPPQPIYPRIFISELRVSELSAQAQQIITSYTNEVPADPLDQIDLDNGLAVDDFLHRPLWRTPTWTDYQRLSRESEYAAWVIYNRYFLNHFTISVANLPAAYNTIAEFNVYLAANGFQLNDSGGKAKTSGDGLLIQSSTVAEMVTAEFDDGNGGIEPHKISGSYVEFAERKVLPQFANLRPSEIRREHLREGFEANNADKIFESTYTQQTAKR